MLNKHKEGLYAVAFDNLNIIYKMNEEKTAVEVVKILQVGDSGERDLVG
jgi:hypothetical protein